MTAPDSSRAAVQAMLGHTFARPALLDEALTHRSAAGVRTAGRTPARRRGAGSNERLEFMGDRVLGLVVAEWLVERFPAEQEGDLGPRHAHLVSRPVLAAIAEEKRLSEALHLAPNEARAGVAQLANVLADAMEALIGALFLDAGLDAARQFIRGAWAGVMEAQLLPPKDPKTRLQEWMMARGLPLPEYRLLERTGPPHAPVFHVGVDGHGRSGAGQGPTKRVAEREAAADLLAQLDPVAAPLAMPPDAAVPETP